MIYLIFKLFLITLKYDILVIKNVMHFFSSVYF